ncbi:MAG TPA: mersacidin/lichenicidin family type 2 lantibiotic [Blastocatellia bacterium]|nr:mersacidin/lichenicidin family type 2 lantibiotic [Blastocatellia bacterium]
MSHNDVIRAWKDAEYRASLSNHRRAALPANPAGPTDLSDEDLAGVVGGSDTATLTWITFTQTITVTVCPSVVISCSA